MVDPTTLALDVSDYKLSQTDSNKSFKLPAGTKIPIGGYIVIARKADKAAFEKHWGVTFGKDTVFINSADKIPSVNGKETFTIRNAAGQVLDGPTVAMDVAKDGNYQRKVPVGPAADAASWKTASATAPNATPGGGQGLVAKSPGLYISEMSDSKGSGKFIFEFVELHYPGPK